jgi:2-amino-4-hydroxy-6-hydroxymethyldihydropteridine diphosphokinase
MDYYLIGLGSNLQPEKNMLAAQQVISALTPEIQVLEASQVLINPPCGNSFHHPFHNQLLIIHSGLNWQALKNKFEQIEVQLGREEKNPQRKFKDRTIDIDILHQASSLAELLKLPIAESYNQQILANWPKAKQLLSDHVNELKTC